MKRSSALGRPIATPCRQKVCQVPLLSPVPPDTLAQEPTVQTIHLADAAGPQKHDITTNYLQIIIKVRTSVPFGS